MRKNILLVCLAFALSGFAAMTILAEDQVPTDLGQVTLSFAPVVKKSAPSVVNIYAKVIVEAQVNPFANDPFFSDFFKNFGDPAPRVQNSLGSGVILSPDGLVVSNFHVVGRATEIRVVLSDRREFDARVLLADEQNDLAVLKIDGVEDLPAMALRKSTEIEVGDLVLAIGNPFGVGQTVSSGIVSGLARSGGALGNARAYFLQTDAPINPGNSGGALVDMSGALVGINTSILTRSGGSNGIGFAIPADLVAQFLGQAQAGNSHFQRPWAGMIGQLVDGTLAEGFDLERPEGMVVVELHPASPYAAGGIKQGDVITEFNGLAVNGPAELLYHMSVVGIGSNANVGFVRQGKRQETVIAMEKPGEEPPRNTTVIEGTSPLAGLTVAQINPAVLALTGLSMSAKGVVVLEANAAAARLGFLPGDVLSVVNEQSIIDVVDAVRVAAGASRIWDISIDRGGQTLSMRVQQ